MNEELQKAEELLGELKKVASNEFNKAKQSPIKTAVKVVVFIWVVKRLWKWLDTKSK